MNMPADINMHVRNERGFISVICLLLVLLAVLIGCAIATQSITQLRQARITADRNTALSIAEAGAEYTIAKIRQSATYSGTGGHIAFGDGTFNTVVTSSTGGSFKIVSTGALPNATSRIVEIELTKSGSSTMPGGAIVSNGGAKLTGNSTLKTSPLNQHVAHVYANQDIQSVGNTNVDGGLYAAGTVTTTGNTTCLERVNGAPQVQFPTEEEIQAQNDAWKAQAQQGTWMGGISSTGNQHLTYASPLYIDGNITLIGNSWITFTGSGTVYVNGNVTLTGNQQLINGGTLVVKGTIQQTGNSKYSATGDLGTCGLVSLSNNATQAIQCTGNGDSSPMGLIYAPRGGIKFTGNSSVYGGVVAGSTSSQAVTCVGNGSINYPPALANNELLPKTYSVATWLER